MRRWMRLWKLARRAAYLRPLLLRRLLGLGRPPGQGLPLQLDGWIWIFRSCHRRRSSSRVRRVCSGSSSTVVLKSACTSVTRRLPWVQTLSLSRIWRRRQRQGARRCSPSSPSVAGPGVIDIVVGRPDSWPTPEGRPHASPRSLRRLLQIRRLLETRGRHADGPPTPTPPGSGGPGFGRFLRRAQQEVRPPEDLEVILAREVTVVARFAAGLAAGARRRLFQLPSARAHQGALLASAAVLPVLARGHHAAWCTERKRWRSPCDSGGRRQVRPQDAQRRRRAESADTVSGSSVSTGRSTSIPMICAASPRRESASGAPRQLPRRPVQDAPDRAAPDQAEQPVSPAVGRGCGRCCCL